MKPDDAAACARLGRALRALPEVRLAYLFGGRARGWVRPESDYDIALLVDDGLVEDPDRWLTTFRDAVAAIGTEVPGELDIVFLNQASDLLKHRVLRDGILLFARSAEERVRFALRTIRAYQDSEHRRNELTRHRIRRIAEALRGGRGG